MQLQLQNFTTLVENMAASIQGGATALLDLTTGSVLRAILEANASLALWLQWLIVQVLAQTRAATSNGTDLDSWVGDFGLTRLPGQAAVVSLTFSRISIGMPAVIPVGAQVKTADNTQIFTVVADSTNPAFSSASQSYALAANVASVSVAATAVVIGAAGNVHAGTITLLATAMPGIDNVSNAAAASGGFDSEADAALRARFTNFIDSRSRATPAAIAFTIQSLQQGLDYVLLENTDPSGASRHGFFTVTVDDGSGSPTTGLISNVYSALDAVRPVGTQLAVQPPQLMIANVSLALNPSAETQPTVAQAVQSAIQAYISSLPIGTPLPMSRISALAYGISSTIVNVTAVSINGAGDLIPSATGIIRPGTIAVN